MNNLINQLLKELNAVWLIQNDDKEHDCHGQENSNERGISFGVSKTNIKPLIIELMLECEKDTEFHDTMIESIIDNVSRIDIDERFYAQSSDSAFEQANASIESTREIDFSWFSELLLLFLNKWQTLNSQKQKLLYYRK